MKIVVSVEAVGVTVYGVRLNLSMCLKDISDGFNSLLRPFILRMIFIC